MSIFVEGCLRRRDWAVQKPAGPEPIIATWKGCVDVDVDEEVVRGRRESWEGRHCGRGREEGVFRRGGILVGI